MNWQYLQQKIPKRLMLVICVSGSLIVLSALTRHSFYAANTKPPHTQLSPSQIQSAAGAITVKVLSTDELGSGILIKKQGEVYTVITNAHVLRAGEGTYRLQTQDGQIYPAWLLQTKFKPNDLALLQFRTRNTYSVGMLGSSFNLAVGQDVFAAGYAFADEAEPKNEKQKLLKGFAFKSGKVSLMLDQALEGGYQVGYTNDIQKGMSGGPLLNHWGEVVGINGKHAYPLWDAPSVFQDGSQACDRLHNLINRTSWAVPIETLVARAPESILLNRSKLPTAPSSSKLTKSTSSTIAPSNSKRIKNKNCQELKQLN